VIDPVENAARPKAGEEDILGSILEILKARRGPPSRRQVGTNHRAVPPDELLAVVRAACRSGFDHSPAGRF
jgi:hypothetical protein